MKFSDEQIIEIISDYIFDERNKQAILIDGEWGCGKTYFVEKKLIPALKENEKKYKVIYTSLYGLETCSEIKENIYDILTKNIIKNKILKNKVNDETIEKGLNVVSKFISVALNKFEIDKDKLPNIEEFINFENLIVIFDDLERCNIEINKVLGFINDLVEHDNIRVIIVSNQAEIGKINLSQELPQKYSVVLDNNYVENGSVDELNNNKKDIIKRMDKDKLIQCTENLFSNDILYEKIKEKLIGITITYKNDINEIYLSIIETYIKDENVKTYLLNNKDVVLKNIEVNKNNNLRNIIFSIMAFEKIYLFISKIINEKEYFYEEIDKILRYLMKIAIKIKSGEKLYNWKENSAKYGFIYFDNAIESKNYIYGYKFVDDYLINRYLDENEVKKVFEEIVEEKKKRDKYENDKENLSYYKLIKWYKLKDNEIKTLLSNLLIELKEKKYSVESFSDIIVILMRIKHYEISNINYNDYIKEMELYLKENKNISKEKIEILTPDENLLENYNKIAKPLFDILENNKKEENNKINIFFNEFNVNTEKLIKYCRDNKDKFTNNKKFIYYVNVDNFINKIKTSNINDIYNVGNAILSVYNFGNLNDFFKSDIKNLSNIIENLNKLINDIKKTEKEEGNITKRIALENLKNILEKKLEIIEK